MNVSYECTVECGEIDTEVEVDIEELLSQLDDDDLLEVIGIAKYNLSKNSTEDDEQRYYWEIENVEDELKLQELQYFYDNLSLSEIDKLKEYSSKIDEIDGYFKMG